MGKSFRYLVLYVVPKLKEAGKIDGLYSVDLKADDIFNRAYGNVKLIYSVENDIAIIEDIEPSEFLITGYFQDLDIYKGTPYRDDKDLFKIKVLLGEENEILKELNICVGCENNPDYKLRCEKAINFINKTKGFIFNEYEEIITGEVVDADGVLDILEGENNE